MTDSPSDLYIRVIRAATIAILGSLGLFFLYIGLLTQFNFKALWKAALIFLVLIPFVIRLEDMLNPTNVH